LLPLVAQDNCYFLCQTDSAPKKRYSLYFHLPCARPSLPWTTLCTPCANPPQATLLHLVDMTPSTNAIGTSIATTKELPSGAFCPDGAIDLARIDDSRLSECAQASHLSACTAEIHASVITDDSMLNHEPLPVIAVTSSGDRAEVSSESSSYKGLAQCVIVCSTSSNENHFATPETEVRAPNDPLVDTDNPANHRLCQNWLKGQNLTSRVLYASSGHGRT
jgi:hypothetical protein